MKMLVIKFFINDWLKSTSTTETLDTLRLHSFIINEENYSEVQKLDDKLKEHGLGGVTLINSLTQPVGLDSEYSPDMDDTDGSLKINKEINRPHFYTENGFSTFLAKGLGLSKVDKIELGFITKPFCSQTILFAPLYEDSNIDFEKKSEQINILKYVKYLNKASAKYLPDNILNWIVPNPHSGFPLAWIQHSTIRLIASLCSELYLENNATLVLEFKGEGRRKVEIEEASISNFNWGNIFAIVNEAANWVYGSGTDIDSRHTIFNFQIAALLPNELKLTQGGIHDLVIVLENAVENAALAYRFHLQDKSKELTNTLNGLNKTLFDYTNKIRENTAALTGTMWRDFTTTLGFLFLNLALKKPNLPDVYFKWLGYGLSFYLMVSFFFNVWVGTSFYKNLTKSLEDWRFKIYGYLSEEDFKNLVTDGLKNAHEKYRIVAALIFVLYVLMIIAVLVSGG